MLKLSLIMLLSIVLSCSFVEYQIDEAEALEGQAALCNEEGQR